MTEQVSIAELQEIVSDLVAFVHGKKGPRPRRLVLHIPADDRDWDLLLERAIQELEQRRNFH